MSPGFHLFHTPHVHHLRSHLRPCCRPSLRMPGGLERQIFSVSVGSGCRGFGSYSTLGQCCLGFNIALSGDTLWAGGIYYCIMEAAASLNRLCFVCEAGPHLLELGPGNAEDGRHESVVSCREGHVPAVGHAHGAALRRTAALYESATNVRVVFCLQGWGGENGGRQSSQGAVPREGVLRRPVLLQLKKTKKSGGKGVRQRLDSRLVCDAHAADIFAGGWKMLLLYTGPYLLLSMATSSQGCYGHHGSLPRSPQPQVYQSDTGVPGSATLSPPLALQATCLTSLFHWQCSSWHATRLFTHLAHR